MKHLPAVLILACTSCSPVPLNAVELDGNTIRLTAEEAAKCAAGGGCVVVPMSNLIKIMEAAQGCLKRNWL